MRCQFIKELIVVSVTEWRGFGGAWDYWLYLLNLRQKLYLALTR